MLSSKEYYYSCIAPDEVGKSYQQVYQANLHSEENDELSRQILEHRPNFSNDFLIEGYISDLIKNAPSPIKTRLESLFVAKRRSFTPKARAALASGSHLGNLIIFHVGLSDLCLQYALLFTEFVTFMNLRSKEGDNSTTVKTKFISLCANAKKLTLAQREWNGDLREIRLKEETLIRVPGELVDQAVGIAVYMDKFILHHEIGHHLMGHTTGGAEVAEAIRSRIAQHLFETTASPKHQREFEADVCGLLLSKLCLTSVKIGETELEVILGSLLAQTVLSQLTSDVEADSLSHPSWSRRDKLCTQVLKDEFPGKTLESILGDVDRFRTLLFELQKNC